MFGALDETVWVDQRNSTTGIMAVCQVPSLETPLVAPGGAAEVLCLDMLCTYSSILQRGPRGFRAQHGGRVLTQCVGVLDPSGTLRKTKQRDEQTVLF